MKIAMFTNTYLPHVGGVARSVSAFAACYRAAGHECLIIAPEFDGEIEGEKDVIRVPAITNFNESGFSYRIPFIGDVSEQLEEFAPDIIHSHHPFLLGDTAIRIAHSLNVPVVFTHHTLYEEYTNYLPFDSDFTKKAAIELATAYANSCSAVFAPSRSVADLIQERGVTVPVYVQPTGIDVDKFRDGDGERFRKTHGIGDDSFVIGHVGRIAKEKNLIYLAESCCEAMKQADNAVFVLVGSGEDEAEVANVFEKHEMAGRFIAAGTLQGNDLWDAYCSFDVFAFSSQSETQGLVVAEAMAGNAPVVALDGPGVSDVLRDGENGCLLPADASSSDFAAAIGELVSNKDRVNQMREAAAKTAREFSDTNLSAKAIENYQTIVDDHSDWIDTTGIENLDKILLALEGELKVVGHKLSAVATAIVGD